MRKILLALFCFIFLLAGCSNTTTTDKKDNVKIKVGASAVPHAEILNFIKPNLLKEGIDLEIIEMSDYIRPNLALSDKEIDANFFQHIPYLESFSKDRNLDLVVAAKVHIEPMGIYSQKLKSLEEIPENATVAIPNDPTNGGRALLLLAKAKIITLKEDVGIEATVNDIDQNPKKITIKELEAAQLPRSFEDVTLAIINTNYALDAKLNPLKDALFIEDKDSPYVNILAVRQGDEKRPEIQKLSATLTSSEVKKFIEEQYKGAITPAF